MQWLETLLADYLNNWLWTWVLPILLIGAGLYFGIRTILVQARFIPDMLKAVSEKPAGGKNISAFKAFSISAASRVGTGNVAGVALAITTGGPGAVFWMWVIAFVGGATSFVESTLAQLWKTPEGEAYRGGPAYYMTRGLGLRKLAVVFAIAISITYGLVYNAIQTNSIVDTMATSFQNDSMSFKVIVGALLAVGVSLVIFGGLQRIAAISQLIVPFMAGAYIIVGVLVIALNIQEVPGMIATIIGHALGFQEIAGATIGMAFMHGMRRGLFSNEAGEGSAPNAAATATVSHPVKQGLVQTLGVYFDTWLVCSITAFIVLLGSDLTYGVDGAEGASLTQAALAHTVGDWGIHFITFVLFFLAFSSLVGNYYLSQANIQYLTESTMWLNLYRALVLVAVFGGSIGSLALVWNLGDTFAATMVIINLIAVIPLGGVAIKLLRNYAQQRRRGLDPVFHRDMLPELKNVEVWDGRDAATANAQQRLEEMKTWGDK